MRANAADYAGSGKYGHTPRPSYHATSHRSNPVQSAYDRAMNLINQAHQTAVNNAYNRATSNINHAHQAAVNNAYNRATNNINNAVHHTSTVPATRLSSSPAAHVTSSPTATAPTAPSATSTAAAPIDPIDFSKYSWTAATLDDLAKKYGVDYSMEAAKRMAEAQAAAQQTQIGSQQTQNQNTHQEVLKQLADALKSGLANTDQSYFLKGLDNSQQLADNGINAGLARNSDLRLAMAKQSAIGDLSNTNQQQIGSENNRFTSTQQQLSQALADLAANTQTNAQNIYDTRLQQAFAQLNTINSQRQQDALARLQAALQQRGQNIDLKNSSDQNAWNVYQLGQQIGYYNNQGFNQSSGGGGNLPGNYQQDLATAAKLEGIPQNQLGAFNWIIQHESSFNPNAKNPNSSAYGYGQFLNQTIANYDKKTGLNYRSSPVDQLRESYRYMVDRYGSPAKAMLAWKQKGWY